MQNESASRDAQPPGKTAEPDRRQNRDNDNAPTECGLTREELRVLVAEMIG